METPPVPDTTTIYSGVIVSQDLKQNLYIYSPQLPYEILLSTNKDAPTDLKITEFVEFKCSFINT
jgi:protein-disulfide isomerase